MLVDTARDYMTFEPKPTPDELRAYYQWEYPRTRRDRWFNVTCQYDVARWSSILSTIDGLVPEQRPRPSIRIHDVGCGFGGLVAHLNNRGFTATGTDPIAEAISAGRREKENNAIYCADTIEYLGCEKPYDIIILHHVLEHLPDPQGFLTGLRRYLTPNALIIARVPNSRYYSSSHSTIRAHWYGYPNHLHYFGPESFLRLFRSSEFLPIEIQSTETAMQESDEQIADLIALATQRGEYLLPHRSFVQWLCRRMETKELQIVARTSGRLVKN